MVLRGHSAALVPGAVWVLCVLAVVDAAIEGSAGYALRTTALMSAIAFGAWLVLASPCLEVGRDGLRVVNPLRVHMIPFGALDAVRVRGLTSVTARERSGRLRSITSWNAPGVPKLHDPTSATVGVIIERARSAWEGACVENVPGVVTTSWRTGPALIMGALVAANIAIWLR